MIQKHKTYSLMKTILNISIYIIGVITTMGATYAQGLDLSRDQNYMMAVRAQEPFATVNELETAPQEQKIYNITYYDGLGRPMQQTGINASPNSKDIITHIGYDGYGRQARHYLPYRDDLGVTGSYREVDVNQHINTYYKNKYADDFPGITDMNQINAYSESIFEPSPLNRVREQGAPGKAWKADPNSDTDHTIKFDWGTNVANEVVYFKVHFADATNTEAPSLEKVEFYNPGELQVSITKDENWQPGQTHPNDHTAREYKDKLGRVVLKRTYNEGEEHDTYYVYDGYGNLTYVLPPKVTTTDGVSDTELSELCYQYKYDYRNRLIEKKIPGKGWEYIVYNTLDQPIMTQDTNLEAENKWLFSVYDAFGRVAYTGVDTNNTKDRKTIQAEANNASSQFVTKTNTAQTYVGATVYYSKNAYPVSFDEVYTINYYDDYTFLGTSPVPQLANPGTVYGESISNKTTSLVTGSKVKVLGTDQWITTVMYYDKKARPICTATVNDYLGTSDITETKLDFLGKVLETTTKHNKIGQEEIVTVDKFTYDHMGRLLTQTQKINNQAEEMIVSNTYDELGQLQSKTVGSGLQDVNYTYNIRGWLRGINDVNQLGNDLFGFAIDYNTGINPLYNGNISATSWQTANDNVTRSYTYTYDALNRITSGVSNDGRYDLSNVSYDKMGNVLSLNRKGHTNAGAITFGDMDILSYTYDIGNKLLKVTDTGSKDYGFKGVTNTNDDFEYDASGNMIKDQNKGIIGITYNHLNLPETVSISNSEGSGTISYIYDATGVKVKKIDPSGGSLIETEYAGNYVYKSGNLEFFNHPEGIVEKEADGYKYVYQFKDHLDNIRLSYKDANKDGTITQDEIVQEKNYYPFGLTHKGYNDVLRGRNHNYGFGNKEEQDEIGLGWIDITARNYDPALGRWMNLDPLADQMSRHSPYNYAFDNPIYYIDPDGMAPRGTDPKLPKPLHTFFSWLEQKAGPTIEKGGRTAGEFLASFNPVITGMNLYEGVTKGEDVFGNEMSKGDVALEVATSLPITKPLKALKGADEAVKIVSKVEELLTSAKKQVKALDSDAIVGFRGSLATGKKFKSGKDFDPTDFDVDAFIVSDKLAGSFKKGGFRNGRKVEGLNELSDDLEKAFQNNFTGYRVEKNKPFTFRVFTEVEFEKVVKPNGFKTQ